MQINWYFIVPFVAAVVCLLAWLAYRNVKDEKKMEQEMEEEEELHADQHKPHQE